MANLNITNIPAPRVPFIDERTGLMAREWYRFFLNLFVLTGSGNNPISLEELQLGPPNQPDLAELLIQINQNIAPQYEDQSGDFLATLDTAQLMSMMSRFENAEAAIQGAYLQPVVQTGTIASYNLDGSPTAGGIAYGTGPALEVSAAGSSGQVLTSAGAATPTWTTPTTGTVTAVSVVSANGLAGTSSGGATPALTLSTTVTGVVKGNGTALSAATAATDYVAPSAYASANGLTMATARLLGRTTASTGAAEEISVAGGLTLSAGTLTGASGTVTSVTGTSPVVSSGGATPAISMPAATTSVNGYLTSTDWTTFNNKGSGTVTSVTGTAPVVSSGGATPAISMAAATTSVNGYLTSTDWTTFNNKQAALVSGTNIKTVNGTTLLGSGDLGTITYAYGGTGLTSYTAGDIIYASAANTVAKLAIGTSGQRLVVAGGLPSWATDTTVGTVTSVAQSFTGGLISVAGSPITTSGTLALTVAGTSGGIPYFSSASTWASSAALAAGSLVLGGGAGVTPATTTTGTGVVTALGVNTGTAGAFVVNGGALGTPSSGTVTNLTGTASININGTVGATTATTGKFTTLAASGIVTFQSSSNPNSRNLATSGLIYNEGAAGNAGFEFKNTTSGTTGYFTIETGDIQQLNMNGGQKFVAGGGLVLQVAPAAASVTGTLSSTGVLSTTDTTDASSTTTGALKTAGGLGVVKKLYVGAEIYPDQTKGIVGTTTNNSAQAGSFGEYVDSSVTTATVATAKTNVTTISLTAGDWDVSAVVETTNGGVNAYIGCSISQTSAAFGPAEGKDYVWGGLNVSAGIGFSSIPRLRVSLSATTTIYLVSQVPTANITSGVAGYISARRMR